MDLLGKKLGFTKTKLGLPRKLGPPNDKLGFLRENSSFLMNNYDFQRETSFNSLRKTADFPGRTSDFLRKGFDFLGKPYIS